MPIYGGFALSHGQTLGTVTGLTTNALQILKLDWDDIDRKAIEVTNMNVQPTTGTGFGNTIHIPSCYVNPGTLKLNVNHDPTMQIPITDPSDVGPVSLTITLGPAYSTQETFVVLGFVTKYKITGPLDGAAVTADVEIKLTDAVDNSYGADGAVAWTTAS